KPLPAASEPPPRVQRTARHHRNIRTNAKGYGMSEQVARLQAAVRDMLDSLNALEYSHYNTRNNLEAYKPSTIETYGLTQEDMESVTNFHAYRPRCETSWLL